jgi:hypothetical protein
MNNWKALFQFCMRNLSKLFSQAPQKLLIFLTIPLSFSLVSCGAGALVGGSQKMFRGTYSMQLMNHHADILDIITAVGKSMSLDVSAIDSSKGEIVISGRTAPGTSVIVGNMSSQEITVKSTDQGTHLFIGIFVQGNFGAGTKEAADDLFAEFRTKLLEKAK